MAGPRDTIKARIALDGAEEIKKELQDLGAVGEAAWAKLKRAAESFKIPDQPLSKLKQLQQSLAETGNQLSQLGASFTKAGAAATLAFSAPVGAFLKGAIGDAADFEKAIVNLGASAQASGGELEKMQQLALDLGKKFGLSSTEIAKAIEEMAKQGTSTSQILDGAAEAVITLARANNGQLAPAATLVNDVLRNFGLTVKDLPSVIDQTTGALLLSKGEFLQFQQAVGQVGAVAGNFGVDYENFAAAIAATAPAFSAGSDAGTSFKTFLQRLNPTTKEAAKIAEELGLQFYDTATHKMKPMPQIIDEIVKGFGKLNDEDRNAKLVEFFGTDAIRTALALLKLGVKGLEDYKSKMRDTSAEKVAQDRMKGLRFEWEKFQAAVERLGIAIGNSGILTSLSSIVDKLTELVDKLSQSNPALLKWGFIFAAIAVAIAPVVVGIGLLLLSFGEIAKAAAIVIGWLDKFPAAMRALGVAARFVMGPWVALAVFLYTFWDDLVAAAQDFWNALFGNPLSVQSKWIAAWGAAITRFKDAIIKLMNGDLSGAWDEFKKAAEDVWKAIQETAKSALENIGISIGLLWIAFRLGAFKAATAWVVEFTKAFLKIRAEATGTALAIQGQFVRAGAVAAGAQGLGGVVGILGRIGAAVRVLAGLAAWTILIETLLAIYDHWDDIVRGFEKGVNLDGTTNKVNGFWENVGKGAKIAVNGITKWWNDLPNILKQRVDDANNAIDQALQNGSTLWQKTLDGFWTWLDGQNKMALRQLEEDWNSISGSGPAQWLKEQIAQLDEFGKAIDRHDWSKVWDMMADPFREIVPGLKSLWQDFLDYMDDQNKLAVDMVIKDWNDLKYGLKPVTDFLKQQFSELGDLGAAIKAGDTERIKELLLKPFTDARAAIKTEMNGINTDTEVSLKTIGSTLLNFRSFFSQWKLMWGGLSQAARTEMAKIPAAAKDMKEKTRAEILEATANGGFRRLAEDGVSEWQRLRTGIYKVLQEVNGDVADTASKAIEKMTDANTAIVKVWNGKNLIGEFATQAQSALDKMEAGTIRVGSAGEYVVRVYDKSATAIQKAKDEVAKLGDKASEAAKKTAKEQPFTEYTFQATEAGKKAYAALAAAQDEAAKHGELVWKNFHGYAHLVPPDGSLDPLVEQALRASGRISSELAKAIPNAKLKEAGNAALDGMGEKAAIEAAKMKQALTGVGDPLKAIPEKGAEALKQTKSEAQQTADAITKSFETVKGVDWAAIGAGAKATFDQIVAGAGTAATSVTTLNTALASTKSTIEGISFEGLSSKAGDVFLALVEKARTAATEVGAQFTSSTADFALLKQGADGAFQEITGKARELVSQIGLAIAGLQPNWTPLISSADLAFQTILERAKKLAADIASALSGGGAAPAAPQGDGAAPASNGLGPFEGMVGQAQQAVQDMENAFANVKVEFAPLVEKAAQAMLDILIKVQECVQQVEQKFREIDIDWSQIVEGVSEAAQQIIAAFQTIPQEVLLIFQEVVSNISDAMATAEDVVRTSVANMISYLQDLQAEIQATLDAMAEVDSGGGDVGDPASGFATGGFISGRGTGTSDEIPIWASNGEFMLTARAVKKYGLGFLNALNNLRLPKSLFKGMKGFATGGLIGAMPRFSAGGLVQRMSAPLMPAPVRLKRSAPAVQARKPLRPINLSIGGQGVGTVLAPEGVAARLHSYAQGQAMRQAGAAPSWKR